jgi:transcriptional regulator CtsR
MDSETFRLLVNVLGILRKQSQANSMEAIMEIVDSYTEEMTQDQKSEILKHLLFTARLPKEKEQLFTRAVDDERFRQASRGDYF